MDHQLVGRHNQRITAAHQCALQGGLVLGLLAVTAQVFDATCMATLGAHLSATSLLIIVGTIMQSSRQVSVFHAVLVHCTSCMQ